jgi:Putative Actinobacterial Holin-X, holin superfamily III
MISTSETGTQDTRTLSELFSDLTRQLAALLRQEWMLARTELSEKVSRVGRDAVLLVAGGLVAYAGFLALLAAIIIGLATLGMAWWLSATLVALVVLVIGGLLIQQGISRLQHEDLEPKQTLETLRGDALMLKREAQGR